MLKENNQYNFVYNTFVYKLYRVGIVFRLLHYEQNLRIFLCLYNTNYNGWHFLRVEKFELQFSTYFFTLNPKMRSIFALYVSILRIRESVLVKFFLFFNFFPSNCLYCFKINIKIFFLT